MKRKVFLIGIMMTVGHFSQTTYKFTKADVVCEQSAGTSVEGQAVCIRKSVKGLEKKILQKHKMTKQALAKKFKELEKQCIKEEIKEGMVHGTNYDNSESYYIYGCIRDKLYPLTK